MQLGERGLTLQTSARGTFYRPSVQGFARSEFIDGATCMLCVQTHKTTRERNRKQGENKERIRDVKSIKQNGQTNDGYKRGEYILTWTKLNLEMYSINKQKVFE